jgi:hypothetical protein
MISAIKRLIDRLVLARYRVASIDAVHGYGDMNIDSSSPGRHTPGY